MAQRFRTLRDRWVGLTVSVRVALAVSTLVGAALSASRLLGIHGPECALILGLVLPPFSAAAAASTVARARGVEDSSKTAGSLLLESLASAIGVGLPALLITALNALRVRNCAPLEGLAFMALGPGLGTALAGLVGLWAGATLTRRWAIGGSVGVVIASALVGLWEFWATPGIFVFGQFAGWFPGTLYDQGTSLTATYLGYRLVTGVLAAALATAFAAVWNGATRTVSLPGLLRRPVPALASMVCGISVIVAYAHAADLGHRSSPDRMRQDLGGQVESERCQIVAPRELPTDTVERIGRECDFFVAYAESILGVRQRARIVAYFFRSAEEKQRLMGAGRTYIAKPWRNEVYLQHRPWPHPVLFHEIVHVVAGNTAQGPFLVGGQVGGLVPDPALIEGVAVAVAWGRRGGMTPHQWARALRELELLPPLDRVVGLSFLGQPAKNAYVVAGSFLRFVLDRYGASAVRAAYLHGDIEKATGQSLAQLEQQWLVLLDSVDLPAEALELARARFSAPSIFSAVCPHEVARLHGQLAGDVESGDLGQAGGTCRAILAIDEADFAARQQLVSALAFSGDLEAAARQIDWLVEHRAPQAVVAQAKLTRADATWILGSQSEALASYEALLGEAWPDDQRRSIEVRVDALRIGGQQMSLVQQLLIARQGRGAHPVVATHLAHQIGRQRRDGLGAYLGARQLMFAEAHEEAMELTLRAQRRGLTSRRLKQEARRMEGTLAVALGDYARAHRVWSAVYRDPQSTGGQKADAVEWLARLRFLDIGSVPPRPQVGGS